MPEKEIEDIREILHSVEEFAGQAKLIGLNLAAATAKAKAENRILNKISDDIFDLITETSKVSADLLNLIRVVKMEIRGFYDPEKPWEVDFEKNKEIEEKIEDSLKNILNESQRLLYIIRKLKSVSIDNKIL
jgi:hypothetical protein